MKKEERPFRLKLKKHYHKRFDKLVEHLEKYVEKGQYESLHKLRVDMKKITALLHLAEHAAGKPFEEGQLKPLRKIFKLSGKLRSDKINQGQVNKYCKAFEASLLKPAELAALKHKLAKNQKKYCNRLMRVEEVCEQKVDKVSIEKLQHYFRRQTGLIERFINNPKLKNLHEFRKRIKDEIYLDKLLALEDILPEEKEHLNRYVKLQSRIGDWHDTDKLLTKLKIANSGKVPAGLERENERRIKLIEKELSLCTGKKSLLTGSLSLFRTTGGLQFSGTRGRAQ